MCLFWLIFPEIQPLSSLDLLGNVDHLHVGNISSVIDCHNYDDLWNLLIVTYLSMWWAICMVLYRYSNSRPDSALRRTPTPTKQISLQAIPRKTARYSYSWLQWYLTTNVKYKILFPPNDLRQKEHLNIFVIIIYLS